VTWFDELHKKKGLSHDEVEAELAEGRRLAWTAGITDITKAAQVLVESSADPITRDVAADVIARADADAGTRQQATDHTTDADDPASSTDTANAADAADTAEAVRKVLDEAERKREFARWYARAASAKAAGNWTVAELARKYAEEAATALGITSEEEMKRILAEYGPSATTTRPATTPAPTTTTTTTTTSTSTSSGLENHQVSTNGEITGLSSALNYTSAMAATMAEGAAGVETSIASLKAGEVSGPGVERLAAAQELLAQAQAEFDAAHAAFQQQLNVKEAYEATPGAGNKQFVTSE
jgi:hypothetical protein